MGVLWVTSDLYSNTIPLLIRGRLQGTMLETKWEVLPKTTVVPMGELCVIKKQSNSKWMLSGAMGSADQSDAGCREREASRLAAGVSLATMEAVGGRRASLDIVEMPVDICVSFLRLLHQAL